MSLLYLAWALGTHLAKRFPLCFDSVWHKRAQLTECDKAKWLISVTFEEPENGDISKIRSLPKTRKTGSGNCKIKDNLTKTSTDNVNGFVFPPLYMLLLKYKHTRPQIPSWHTSQTHICTLTQTTNKPTLSSHIHSMMICCPCASWAQLHKHSRKGIVPALRGDPRLLNHTGICCKQSGLAFTQVEQFCWREKPLLLSPVVHKETVRWLHFTPWLGFCSTQIPSFLI